MADKTKEETKEGTLEKTEEKAEITKAPEKPDLPAGRQGIPDKPKPKEAVRPKAPKAPKVKLSKKLSDLIGEIEKLSVLELSDLVKALEKKFGVSGMPAVAPAIQPAAGSQVSGAGESQPSEQTTFNVVLASPGANKISVIKMVREINQTLGLKEAKDLVESTPKEILSGVNKSTAEEAKKKLEGVGASVELK